MFILRRLSKCSTSNLRRLARYLKVRRWSRLRRSELVAEIARKIDPWR